MGRAGKRKKSTSDVGGSKQTCSYLKPGTGDKKLDVDDVEQNCNKIHQTGISTYMFCIKIKQL